MSYTLLVRASADATWQGESAYTLLARASADAEFGGAITGQLSASSPLGAAAGVGESLGAVGLLSASSPLGDPAGLASVTGVVIGDLRAASPLGAASATGTPVIAGSLAASLPGDVAGLAHPVVFGPLRGASPLGAPAGFALHAPSIAAIRGQTVTLYRAALRADGYADLALPISSISARARYGDRSYLSVVIPAAGQYIEAIEERAAGTLIVDAGAVIGGVTHWAELLRVPLDRVRQDIGGRSYSVTIEGYATNVFLPSARTVAVGTYDRQEGIGRSYRLPDVDFNVRPGDQVTLADESTMIVGAISYTINAQRANMELVALTDSTLLATLPW